MPASLFRKLTMIAATAMALSLAAGQSPAATQGDETEYGTLAAETSLSGSFLAAQNAAKSNDDVAAVAFYQRSLALDPDNDELKQMLFLAFSANGRIDEAVELARENFLKVEGPGFARVVVAADALKRKAFARAGEILNESSSADLDKLVDELLVAWASFGSGDTEAAIEKAADFDGPDWVSTIRNYHAGLMAAARGDDASAITYFRSSIENRAVAGILSETYLRAYEGLARALARSGDVEGASEMVTEGLSLLSSNPPFLRLAADLENNKPQTPLVTTAQQGAAEVFFNVGAAISRQNGAPFAQSYLQLARFLSPKSDYILMALANLFETQKNHARANQLYDLMSEDSAYFRRSRLEFALNLNALERVDEAEAELRKLIEGDAGDLLAHTTLGGVLSQRERYEDAAKVYDAAAAQIDEPTEEHWNLFYRRGIAYERIDKWSEAEPSFRKSLELSPEQADVLNYLGYSWVDMGMHLDEGMDMIRKAVELKPRSGYIVDSLGWAYYKLGEYQKAVEELERAIEIMPEDPVINDHLGDAYWRVGRRLEATFQWKHALTFDPEIEEKIKINEKLRIGLKDDAASTASSD